jgi:hypothetical protein
MCGCLDGFNFVINVEIELMLCIVAGFHREGQLDGYQMSLIQMSKRDENWW